MFDRLEDTVNRYEDITAELGNPDVVNDQEKFRKLMKEQLSLIHISSPRDRSLSRMPSSA